MTKPMMQKWQRDWFVKELDRDYNPLIQAAELKIKSLEAEAIEAGKNISQFIEHDYIEFFEMIDPIIMGDSN